MRLFYSNCSEDANIFLENTHQGFLLLNGALVVPHSPPIFTGETNSVSISIPVRGNNKKLCAKKCYSYSL